MLLKRKCTREWYSDKVVESRNIQYRIPALGLLRCATTATRDLIPIVLAENHLGSLYLFVNSCPADTIIALSSFLR